MYRSERENEQGFMLVGLIVAIFIILLVMGVAAPKVARGLRRDREVEAIHRGNQYVRAVQLYYKKFQHYPGSMEQLEKTNNVRFLRQRYADPMTGKADWRLIKVGEAKTTVKGFFGQPLAGLAPGLGTAAGMASSGMGGGAPGSTGASGFGGSSSSTLGSSSPGGLGASSPGGLGSSPGGLGGASASGPGATDASGVSGATGSTTGFRSQSGSGFPTGGAPFVGVGSAKSGESITVLNEQPSYQTWEFIYDPRIEQLKAKASLFGGGPATSSGSNLGSMQQNASPGMGGSSTTTPGSSTTPGFSTTPGSPTTSPTSPSYPSPPSTTPQ
jgi:type II secretory pathway pseudopilin PulG